MESEAIGRKLNRIGRSVRRLVCFEKTFWLLMPSVGCD
jgi:hypothetical protein